MKEDKLLLAVAIDLACSQDLCFVTKLSLNLLSKIILNAPKVRIEIVEELLNKITSTLEFPAKRQLVAYSKDAIRQV